MNVTWDKVAKLKVRLSGNSRIFKTVGSRRNLIIIGFREGNVANFLPFFLSFFLGGGEGMGSYFIVQPGLEHPRLAGVR